MGTRSSVRRRSAGSFRREKWEMEMNRHIGAILDIVRGSQGLEPELKSSLEKSVKALDHALRVRNRRLIHAAVDRIARDVLRTLD
jgi:hypothetical protein